VREAEAELEKEKAELFASKFPEGAPAKFLAIMKDKYVDRCVQYHAYRCGA
jgi:hypothetical protein